MVGILGHQHMREQARSRKPAIYGPRRGRCLYDPVAGVAAQLRSNMTKHLEAGANVLQHLGDIFAEFAQSAAAVGTRFMTGHVGMDLARKMFRQRAAKGLGRCRPVCWSDGLRLFDGAGRLQFFQLQLELLDLTEDLLTPGAEEHALQLLDQQNEALDLARARAKRCCVLLTLMRGRCLAVRDASHCWESKSAFSAA